MLEVLGPLALGTFLILVIIVLNGYFVAQEFAYMSVDRHRLKSLAQEGDKKAQNALEITHKTSFMLSGAQLGITVTGLLVGFIAEPLVGKALAQLIGGSTVPSALAISAGTTLALLFSTVVQMIFGELFPKNYAIAAPTTSARALASSTRIYLKLFGWLIHFFDWSSNSLLRLFKIEPVEDIDSSADTDDLKHIVAQGRETGELNYQTSLLLSRFLEFSNVSISHAMRPHSRTDVLSIESTVAEAKEKMRGAHTRYPVLNKELTPVGVISLLDLLASGDDDSASIAPLLRQPIFLHENMPLPAGLLALDKSAEQLALVIDEYGGFVGILTREDIAEEILGEVDDEHDVVHSEQILPLTSHTWITDGDTSLDEIERLLGRKLPEGNFETVAGLLLHEAGTLVKTDSEYSVRLSPEVDDILENNENPNDFLIMKVMHVERNVPSKIHLTLDVADSAEERK